MARRQKYKFAKTEYAKNGKVSTGLAVASVVLFVVSVILSFALRGEAGVYVGGIGLLSALLAILGFVLGVKGYSEKNCSHLFCTIGTIANGLICIFFLALFSVGVS